MYIKLYGLMETHVSFSDVKGDDLKSNIYHLWDPMTADDAGRHLMC